MPLTLMISEGIIPKSSEQKVMHDLGEAFLRLHGLSGNKFFTPIVIGHIQVMPVSATFAGLKSTPVAIIEWLTPSFGFTNRDIQIAYVKEATDIVQKASGGKHPREAIFVNVKHAVDGSWGISGKAYTNAEMLEAGAKG